MRKIKETGEREESTVSALQSGDTMLYNVFDDTEGPTSIVNWRPL